MSAFTSHQNPVRSISPNAPAPSLLPAQHPGQRQSGKMRSEMPGATHARATNWPSELQIIIVMHQSEIRLMYRLVINLRTHPVSHCPSPNSPSSRAWRLDNKTTFTHQSVSVCPPLPLVGCIRKSIRTRNTVPAHPDETCCSRTMQSELHDKLDTH